MVEDDRRFVRRAFRRAASADRPVDPPPPMTTGYPVERSGLPCSPPWAALPLVPARPAQRSAARRAGLPGRCAVRGLLQRSRRFVPGPSCAHSRRGPAGTRRFPISNRQAPLSPRILRQSRPLVSISCHCRYSPESAGAARNRGRRPRRADALPKSQRKRSGGTDSSRRRNHWLFARYGRWRCAAGATVSLIPVEPPALAPVPAAPPRAFPPGPGVGIVLAAATVSIVVLRWSWPLSRDHVQHQAMDQSSGVVPCQHAPPPRVALSSHHGRHAARPEKSPNGTRPPRQHTATHPQESQERASVHCAQARNRTTAARPPNRPEATVRPPAGGREALPQVGDCPPYG